MFCIEISARRLKRQAYSGIEELPFGLQSAGKMLISPTEKCRR